MFAGFQAGVIIAVTGNFTNGTFAGFGFQLAWGDGGVN